MGSLFASTRNTRVLPAGGAPETAGVSDETIIDDYMESGENLEAVLRAYVSAHPEADIEIILPHRENIERVLNLL